MTDMYDKPKVYDGGKLKPYPHVEPGVEVIFFDSLMATRQFLLQPHFSMFLLYLLHFYWQRGRAKDPVGYLHDVEQRARERQVAIETVKLLRRRVIDCYRKEGVNHYENCKEVCQEYFDQIMKKDLGQLQPKWSNPEMNDGW